MSRDVESVSSMAHTSDGVDRTLIRWFISLTPAERIEALEAVVRDILEIRDANAAVRPDSGDPDEE